MSSKEFGEEKISRLLIKFSIPVIISMLVNELYNMVDTFFVGRSVGGDGIAAIIAVFPFQRVIVALSVMIAVGSMTSFSRHNGERDYNKAKEVLNTGFSMIFAVMIPLVFLVLIFKQNIIGIIGAGETVEALASTYLGIIIFGVVFLGLTVYISHTMIALGNTKVSIVSTSLGAITNVILDYVLVIGYDFGVAGAAIATTISQIVGFIYAFYKFQEMKKEYGISLKFNINPAYILPILLVGISSFVIEAEDGILMGNLSSLLTGAIGDEGLVILGIVSKVYMFLFIPIFGIAQAMQPIAAYNLGANKLKRLKNLMTKTIVFSLAASTALWILSLIFAPNMIKLFIQDDKIIKDAAFAFRIMISAFPLLSVYYVSIFYFQAMGKAKTSLATAILRQLVIMLPISILLVKGLNLGSLGVWLAYPISDFLASLAAFMLIRNEGIELNLQISSQKQNMEEKALITRE
ncbi:MAG TPA: MATE family efflux transporter [Soehngenia sp.]|nr:MATE family efflux transporter [Soehngenia sp.]HPP31423.1 MATE family efflux transporter [Soehngenia sp.]